MLITFVITVFLFFTFIKLMPDQYLDPFGDPAWYEALKAREGWDQPIPVQFWIWIRNIITDGSFGFSRNKATDVGAYYFSKIPASIQINIIPYFLSIPIGIGIGVLAALYKNKWIDNLISVGIMVFISIPYFVIIVLAQYFFFFQLKWVPSHVVATASQFTEDFWWSLSTYIMPITLLTIVGVPGLARSVRAEGLITERLFRVDGTGRIYLDAFNSVPPDYAMLMLINAFGQFVGLLSSIVGDISYTLFDPRIRVGSGKIMS